MRGRVERREQRVHRQQRPQVQVRGTTQLPADLVQVPVELLEDRLQPGEGGLQLLLVGDEVLAREGDQVPVLLAPQRGHLLHAALDAGARGLAVAGNELGLQGGEVGGLHHGTGLRGRSTRLNVGLA